MFALCLKILFSPTEATIEEARNHTQNYWEDGLVALLVAMFFTGLLQTLSSLLFWVFVQEGIYTNSTLPDDISSKMLFFIASIFGTIAILFLAQLVILVYLALFAYQLGGIGSIGQLFFVRSLYNTLIFILYGISTFLILIVAALHPDNGRGNPDLFSGIVLMIVFLFVRFGSPLVVLYIGYIDHLNLMVIYGLSRIRSLIVSIGAAILLGLVYSGLLLITFIVIVLSAEPMPFPF